MTMLFDFFNANFDDDERYYARTYGCAKSAIPGLIYYRDTCAIYERFKDDIWKLINEHGGALVVIDADDYRHPDTFENAMVWKAFEIHSVLAASRNAKPTHH